MSFIRYGEHDSQTGDLYLPGRVDTAPVVITLHGGFWRAPYDRDLMVRQAVDLQSRGYAVWKVSYRRLGDVGGGWPGTFTDVADAVDQLALLPDRKALDLTRVTAIGHSAGGHLALWLAGRHQLPSGVPGAGSRVQVTAVVGQAAVSDLVAAAAERLGFDAVPELLGGEPTTVSDRYAHSSPINLLPTGVPTLLVHGRCDLIVPVEQSRSFTSTAAELGSPTELAELDSSDHFVHLDPNTPGWQRVCDFLDRHTG
ncbi:MAG: alpha/beta hydrolase family protein [Pseudonocardiaceae bacterium]